MTGMLGVGIGEVVIPQLVKKNGVPLPVAAGTSILVVFLNAVGEGQEARKLSLACTVRYDFSVFHVQYQCCSLSRTLITSSVWGLNSTTFSFHFLRTPTVVHATCRRCDLLFFR